MVLDRLLIPFLFLGIVWLLVQAYRASLVHQRFMKQVQLKAELNARMLDRAGSDPAIAELLKSEGQRQILDVQLTDAKPPLPPLLNRILISIQLGIILMSAGTAFLWVQRWFSSDHDRQPAQVIGAVLLAVGIGTVLSAAVAAGANKIWRTLES